MKRHKPQEPSLTPSAMLDAAARTAHTMLSQGDKTLFAEISAYPMTLTKMRSFEDVNQRATFMIALPPEHTKRLDIYAWLREAVWACNTKFYTTIHEVWAAPPFEDQELVVCAYVAHERRLSRLYVKRFRADTLEFHDLWLQHQMYDGSDLKQETFGGLLPALGRKRATEEERVRICLTMPPEVQFIRPQDISAEVTREVLSRYHRNEAGGEAQDPDSPHPRQDEKHRNN